MYCSQKNLPYHDADFLLRHARNKKISPSQRMVDLRKGIAVLSAIQAEKRQQNAPQREMTALEMLALPWTDLDRQDVKIAELKGRLRLLEAEETAAHIKKTALRRKVHDRAMGKIMTRRELYDELRGLLPATENPVEYRQFERRLNEYAGRDIERDGSGYRRKTGKPTSAMIGLVRRNRKPKHTSQSVISNFFSRPFLL